MITEQLPEIDRNMDWRMKWFNYKGTSSTLHKHLICFQDQSPFQKCLTQQELAKPLNSNNNLTVYVRNNENKNFWDILLRNKVILNNILYYALIVDDVVQAGR